MTSRIKRPPGPPGRFPIGNFPMGSPDPLALFTRWAREYGDVFYYRALWIHVYFVNHPDAIGSVLVDRARDFVKGRVFQVNRRLLGDGLLTSDGDAWIEQRRLCQPAFRREKIEAYAETMVRCASHMLDGWHEGETRDLQAELMRLTLDVAARTLFGAEIGEAATKVARALKAIMDFNSRGRILVPALRYLPTPRSVRYQLAVRRLERVVQDIIRRRRTSGGAADDLLFQLLRARDEEASGVTDRLLRDEVMTLLLAGHETTSLTLSWTFYLLALNPTVASDLVAEIHGALGGRPPTAPDIARIPLAGRVIKESLRLYPPAFAMVRIARREVEIGGYAVPRGASIVMSQWVMHRDERFWRDPERFDPGRWTPEFEAALPKFAYFPFGGGPRACIGAYFAITEAILLLVTILQRFRLSLVSNGPVVPVPSFTLRPAAQLMVKLGRPFIPAL